MVGRRSSIWDESTVLNGIQEVWVGSTRVVEEVVRNYFEDKIYFKWGRVVTSYFKKFLISGLWTINGSSKGLELQ